MDNRTYPTKTSKPALYQVCDWDKHFENNKSREREQCSFVCVPNKQHGLGFCRIMAEPDGAAIYGIWHMILGVCSRQKKPRAGWLTHDGHQAGTPLAPSDLALMFRRPEPEISRAVEFLASQAIGWLVVADTTEEMPAKCPPATRSIPAQYPDGALEEKRIEENRNTQKGEGVCVVKASPPEPENPQPQPTLNKRINSGPSAVDYLKTELAALYNRKLNQPWSYADDSALADLARRPDVRQELKEILNWRASLPAPKLRFFPQSLGRLIQNWDDTLDKARSGVSMIDEPPPQKTILEKDIEAQLRQAERMLP